jgi:hypothetical protein
MPHEKSQKNILFGDFMENQRFQLFYFKRNHLFMAALFLSRRTQVIVDLTSHPPDLTSPPPPVVGTPSGL